MGEQVHPTLDEDLFDKVLEEEERTGKSKSKIINQKVREGFNGEEPTLADSILPVFGQSLFIAGFVVAFFYVFVGGVGMSLLGLGLMIGAKVDEYRAKHDTSSFEALIHVLGA